MPAGEILDLARRAGVDRGVPVLDLCCGVAGPGRLITEELGCDYLGVDYSRGAIEIARARTRHLTCRFEVLAVPPLPPGRFDVVLLLETMLAFADKPRLLSAIAAALAPGGRLAITLEEGEPLSRTEQTAMPDADTVHLVPLAELTGALAGAGMHVTWQAECTASHLAVARSLLQSYTAEADVAARQIGDRAVQELLAAHRLWIDWMSSGRVRKFALVAQRGRVHGP